MKPSFRIENYAGIINLVILITGILLFVYIHGMLNRFYSIKYNHYTQLPIDFKNEIEFFKLKAKENQVDIIKLETTKFFISTTAIKIAAYNGACDHEENTIYIPSNKLEKNVFWHELGHCVLDYAHSDNENDLMYSMDANKKKFGEKEIKEFFLYKNKIKDSKL